VRSIAVVIALVGAPLVAHAESQIATGAVVKIEASELYVNLGVTQHVRGGAPIRIKRTISLRHPVTRAQVTDWIPIGSATITQAGAVMSRAVVGELVTDVKVGDIVEILVEYDRPAPPQPPQPQPQPQPPQPQEPPPPPIDRETVDVLGAFAAQASRSIDRRITTWEQYLSTHATSRFAPSVREELDHLRALRDELTTTGARELGETIAVEHNVPEVAPRNADIPVVFVLGEPARVASAYLHFRTRGQRSYRSVLLARENDRYLRGAIPAGAVTAPGVDYFVEMSTTTGASATYASPAAPRSLDVEAGTVLDELAPIPGRSTVRLTGDVLDFAVLDQRSGDRTDRLYQTNVDFTYRIDSPVERIGVGYGVFSGAGGSANAVYDDAMPAPRSAFHYGYADLELGTHQDGVHLSVGGQLIAGVGKEGFGLGAEGRVRIGDYDRTNLTIAARTIDQVGFLSEIRFGTRIHSAVMLGVSVGATNQPTREDVGVKLGTDFEFFANEHLGIILRTSWQGRTTEHSGVGIGAGIGAHW